MAKYSQARDELGGGCYRIVHQDGNRRAGERRHHPTIQDVKDGPVVENNLRRGSGREAVHDGKTLFLEESGYDFLGFDIFDAKDPMAIICHGSPLSIFVIIFYLRTVLLISIAEKNVKN